MITIEVNSLVETFALARQLGSQLFPGAVIALEGTLGAGKTHFVRGIAEGLGIPDSRIVSSPTFVLIQEYSARLPIYHFDAYRLTRVEDFIDLGVHEYFEGNGVCLVEWGDRVRDVIPRDRLWVRFEIIGESARRLHLDAVGQSYQALLLVIESEKR